jgi:hypothetical protein
MVFHILMGLALSGNHKNLKGRNCAVGTLTKDRKGLSTIIRPFFEKVNGDFIVY